MTDAVKENEEAGPDPESAADAPEEQPVEGAANAETPDEGADPSPEAPGPEVEPVDAKADGARSGARSDGALETLRAEYDTLNDRHLRLAAEFNNFRRRSEQERLAAWSRAQADLVENFLDVLDDLHRVAELDLSNASVEAIMEGIDLVEKKFLRVLSDAGVEMIDPTGEPFDPEVMEAMMRVPTESDEQADTVAQVFQKGYSLKGILVRAARVSVYTQG